MKVLRVSGENLASLPRFDVDFTAEPLKGAALFAIAGPTGAGKSTLLDAICLALYGQTPRSGRGERRKVELVPGRKWSGQDERHAVRRGATSASARVLFEVGGERYVARWSVSAATRGANKGALGDPAVKLCRADGAGAEGEVLASGVEDLQAAVERLTGLTFQNFCRSVMLAQGEFSAFLDAKAVDRAKVLEALTDPEGLYRKLSLAAFKRGGEAQKKLQAKRDEVERVTVLPREERERLQGVVAEKLQELETLGETLEGLRKAEAHWVALAEAQRRAAQRVEGAARARAVLAEKGPAERVLKEAESVQPLRAPLTLRAAAARQLEAGRAALQGLAQRLVQAGDSEAAAAAVLEAARAGAAEEERRAAEGQSVRAQAQGVDGERHGTAQQLRDVQGQAARSQQQLDEAVAAGLAVEAELSAVAAKREEHQRWLSQHAEAAQLAARPEAWRGPLGRWVEEEAGLREEQPRLDAATRAAAQAATEAQRAGGLCAEVERQAAAAEEAVKVAEGRRELLGQGVSLERAGALQRQRAALAELERLGRLGEELWHRLQAAEAGAERERRLSEDAAGQLHGLRAGLAAAEAAEQACRGAQAAARAKAQYEAQRQHLVDGEPCPLCGSPEHPWAAGVEAGLDAADAALQQAEAAVASLRQQVERAGEARASAAARAEAAGREVAARRAEREAVARDWAASVGAFPALPAVLAGGGGLPPALQGLAEALDREVSALAEAERQWRAAGEEVARLRAAQGEAARAAREAGARLQQAQETQHRAELARQALAVSVESRAGRMEAALAQGLEGLEAVPQARRRFLEDPAGQLAAWDGLMAGHLACQQGLRELALVEAEALARRQGLAGQVDTARAEQARWAGQAEGLARKVEALAARVAALLGGLTLEAHAARERQRLEAARGTVQQAEAGLGAARAQQAQLQGEQRTGEERLSAAERELQRAGSEVAQVLAGLGLDEPEAARRLAHPEAGLAALREELEAARRGAAEAQALLAAAEAEVKRLEAGQPALDLDAVRQEEAACEARRGAASEALGEARGQLSRDEEAVQRRAGLEAEYEALRAQEGQWGELSALVGSHTGDEFAVYAQGLSLRGVLAAANRELGQLRARYQLARLQEGGGESLELAVRDTTFGGELRPLTTLSGGEKFLSSLALALGLSARASRNRPIETLFIDEGFGTLDKKTLDEAMAALKGLHGRGTQVGIISHVENVKDYVQATVRVRPLEEGLSEVEVER